MRRAKIIGAIAVAVQVAAVLVAPFVFAQDFFQF
jgi:hypothetical protein